MPSAVLDQADARRPARVHLRPPGTGVRPDECDVKDTEAVLVAATAVFSITSVPVIAVKWLTIASTAG